MDDEVGVNSASDQEVTFRDIAEAFADLPLLPMLAIANRKRPLTRDSSPSEVLEMLRVLQSYMSRWLIPALELRINPFASATFFRKPGASVRSETGRVEDLLAAIATIRGQSR